MLCKISPRFLIIITNRMLDKRLNMCYIIGKEVFAMIESIAALSMDMAMQNVQSSVSTSMLKKSIDSTEQTMEAFTKMLDSIPSPDGRGNLLNVRA